MESRYLIFLGLVSPILAEITCGVSYGYDLGTHAYYYSGDGSLASFDACSAKCQTDSNCQSFAFSSSECLLYSVVLDKNFRQQTNSPFLFYDRSCVDVKSTSSFVTTLPTSTPAASVSQTLAAQAPSTPTAVAVTSQAGGEDKTSASAAAPPSTAEATPAAGASSIGGGQAAATFIGTSSAAESAAMTAQSASSTGMNAGGQTETISSGFTAVTTAVTTAATGGTSSTVKFSSGSPFSSTSKPAASSTGTLQSSDGSASLSTLSLSKAWLGSGLLGCLLLALI